MSKEDTSTSDTIAVHWREEPLIRPQTEFVGQSNVSSPAIFERFGENNFPECFDEYARMLTWYKSWRETLDSSNPPFYRWFVGGEINASFNCIDRHLPKRAGQVAFHFVPEPEDAPLVSITYQQLYWQVNAMAAMLREEFGLKRGDGVTLHLPMTLELPITMLACARLGVIHTVVFSGFSGKACGDRIVDSQSRLLITMDGYYRGGKLLDHKIKADEAVDHAAEGGHTPEKVLVFRREPGKYASDTPMHDGRDVFVDEILPRFKSREIEPEHMLAEDTLFLMYTSGSTGKPKGSQHSTGGYLAYAAGTSKYVLDIQPDDVYWCMADIGWITGHSYIVYGPLVLGTTSVLFEGAPNIPDTGRPWRISEQLGVNILHTSPTAVRALRKAGTEVPAQYKYHFKSMTTVGEPIEPEAWRWYYEAVGKGKAVITDTWWQTETGGHLLSTLPAIHDMKPGSTGPALPGIYASILDDQGKEIEPGTSVAGSLCIRNPWPGRMLTIWRDDQRFIDTYYKRFCTNAQSSDWRDWPYFAGDGAVQAADGYYRILGRLDDVINVAGHRLGTKELESSCLTVDAVVEAAVVAVPDEIKGVVPEVFVSLRTNVEASEEIKQRIKQAILDDIGPIAKPRNVWIVPDMPKTRSGKIMRRVLASLSAKKDPGDVSTLANPEIVEIIRVLVQK